MILQGRLPLSRKLRVKIFKWLLILPLTVSRKHENEISLWQAVKTDRIRSLGNTLHLHSCSWHMVHLCRSYRFPRRKKLLLNRHRYYNLGRNRYQRAESVYNGGVGGTAGATGGKRTCRQSCGFAVFLISNGALTRTPRERFICKSRFVAFSSEPHEPLQHLEVFASELLGDIVFLETIVQVGYEKASQKLSQEIGTE